MELTGEQILPLPRERVWAALNDPDVLKASVPGCESFERIDENQFQMVMAASVGPIKARFKGKMVLTDLQPPEAYSLTFEGSGGAAGFGKGGAHVELQPEGEGTKLTYKAHAQVGGRLAQVGARLIDGVARKMAEEFFGRFSATVSGPQEGAGNAAAAADQPATGGGAGGADADDAATPPPGTSARMRTAPAGVGAATTVDAVQPAAASGKRDVRYLAIGALVVLAVVAVYYLQHH